MYVKKTVLHNEKQRHAWLNIFKYVIPGIVFRTSRKCTTFPLHLLVKKPMVGSALWIHARWVLHKQTQRSNSNADDECLNLHMILIIFLQASLMLQCGLHAVLTLHTTHPNSCVVQHKVCYKESIMVWVEAVVLLLEECLLTTLVIITVTVHIFCECMQINIYTHTGFSSMKS